MTKGFQNKNWLQNSSCDGRNCIITDRLHYIDGFGNEYRTDTGWKSDGGSVPPLGVIGCLLMFGVVLLAHYSDWFELLAIPSLLVGVSGLYLTSYAKWWWSYVFHDALYQGRVEKLDRASGLWLKFAPPEDVCNALLYEAMATQGALFWEYYIVWFFLNIGGWRAFNEDRKAAAQ